MNTLVFELEDTGHFEVWRDLARSALQRDIPPKKIEWRLRGKEVGLFDALPAMQVDGPPVREVLLRASCVDLLRGIMRHSDPGRFALAYRIAWRAQSLPAIAGLTTDPDVARARRMMYQVRRDYHKMTAFVRFREQEPEEGKTRRRFLSWFEPEHHVLESVAPFFAGRFADMDWLILTPRGSIGWDGTKTVYSPEPCVKPDIHDDLEALWHTYYASTFNPARIKTKAMRSEMPRKYWKNLPETDLIPELLAGAEARVAEMAAREAGPAPMFHERLQARQKAQAAIQEDALDSMGTLLSSLRRCTRCPLHCNATQVVPGAGPERAEIMVIGEQPGDQEDLRGVPFVGPAGQVFDEALSEAGLLRGEMYLTNAVKHFKFLTKGRRRIHQTPDAQEIEACKDWLHQEVALVRPKLIITLGATALRAMEGGGVRLATVRDTIRPGVPARLATVHPAYLLRLPDEARALEERKRFFAAFEAVRQWKELAVRE